MSRISSDTQVRARSSNFWVPPASADGVPMTVTTRCSAALMRRVAAAIERSAERLPSSAALRRRDCLTAAVYVEGARRNLAVAAASLRMTASTSGDEFVEGDWQECLDPLLADWLG